MYWLPILPHLRLACRPLLACTVAAAAALAGGCAKPQELLMTGATGRPLAAAPWRTQAAPSAEAVRPLSDGEGEVVVASAIAAHEMRRP